MSVSVAIVGGGLSGLFTASELIAAGINDLVVVDTTSEPGGIARTVQRDGYSLEPAAGTLLLPNQHLTPVLRNLGAEVVPAADCASVRYVFTGKRLVTLPSSPRAAFAPLVPVTAKLRAALEPFVRSRADTPDESLDAFLQRRFGKGLGRMLAWLAASGVFGGDPTRLSARASFPALPALEDDAGSIVRGGIRRLRRRPRGSTRPTSHLPAGGMTRLAETAMDLLGNRFRGDFDVASVHRDGTQWVVTGPETITAEHLVLACRPTVAGRLLTGDLADHLAGAISAPTVVVGLGGPAASVPLPNGFGVLSGPEAGTATLGVLFESSYAPDRAPQGHALAKVIIGGARRPEIADWEDDRIVSHAIEEVGRILGTSINPSFVEVVRHRPGIPQYEIGHMQWLAELESLVRGQPGLHLTGWGYRGISVAHLAGDATEVARTISDRAGV